MGAAGWPMLSLPGLALAPGSAHRAVPSGAHRQLQAVPAAAARGDGASGQPLQMPAKSQSSKKGARQGEEKAECQKVATRRTCART